MCLVRAWQVIIRTSLLPLRNRLLAVMPSVTVMSWRRAGGRSGLRKMKLPRYRSRVSQLVGIPVLHYGAIT